MIERPNAQISAITLVDGTGEAHPQGSYVAFTVTRDDTQEQVRFKVSIEGVRQFIEELEGVVK